MLTGTIQARPILHAYVESVPSLHGELVALSVLKANAEIQAELDGLTMTTPN